MSNSETVYFDIYLKTGDEGLGGVRDETTYKRFEFPLTMRVIDIRDEIMWKMYDGCEEREQQDLYYLEMENHTPKLYKEFGKLFFNFGLIPKTQDNYPLSRITSDGKTYIFEVYKVLKSQLSDYVPVKKMYEMTEEEKQEFNNKAVSKNTYTVKSGGWDDETVSSSDEEIPDSKKKLTEEEMREFRKMYEMPMKNKYSELDW
jgi:hypothetical protein